MHFFFRSSQRMEMTRSLWRGRDVKITLDHVSLAKILEKHKAVIAHPLSLTDLEVTCRTNGIQCPLLSVPELVLWAQKGLVALVCRGMSDPHTQ